MVRRTTVNLDMELVAEARAALGVTTTTDAIHQALRDAVRRKKLEGLRDFRMGPDAYDELMRHRREETASAEKYR